MELDQTQEELKFKYNMEMLYANYEIYNLLLSGEA